MGSRVSGAILAAMLAIAGCVQPAVADTIDHFTLFMVWMPGLCKLEGDRPECKDLSIRRYDGRNLAFMALQGAPAEHGIANSYCDAMPNDSEMDRARQWCDMDKPRITAATRDALNEVMPIVQSCQDRGIWAKYGSCSLYSADAYFARGIKIARQVAATQINTKIAGAAGGEIGQDPLLAAFTADFGEDSEKAVNFICRKVEGKSHLYQIKITLSLSSMNRGLAKDQLWIPNDGLRRGCPARFMVDLPPVQIAPEPAVPAPPAPPSEPPAPESAPVAPVEIAPLPPGG